MAKGKLIRGALWLTLTGAVLRAVGMAYRVFISGKLGEETMGIYQLILSVYMLGSTLASAGVAIAVTRLVSAQCVTGGKSGVRRILRFALLWSMGMGGAVAAVLLVGAPVIAARWIGASDAAAGLRILALGLPFMSAAACFNGYFLGVGRVSRSCFAQIADTKTYASQALRQQITPPSPPLPPQKLYTFLHFLSTSCIVTHSVSIPSLSFR